MCTVGSGTVVHPTAVIKAEAGPIVIGGLNIIEEHTQILHLSNATSNHTDVITSSTMTIGSHNMFEVGSRTCSGYCLVVWLSCCDVLATTPSHLSVSLSLFFFLRSPTSLLVLVVVCDRRIPSILARRDRVFERRQRQHISTQR
jgi:hypothetical protein